MLSLSESLKKMDTSRRYIFQIEQGIKRIALNISIEDIPNGN
jgi:hypothetical protein